MSGDPSPPYTEQRRCTLNPGNPKGEGDYQKEELVLVVALLGYCVPSLFLLALWIIYPPHKPPKGDHVSHVGAHGVIPHGSVVTEGDTGEVRFQGCEEMMHGDLYTSQV